MNRPPRQPRRETVQARAQRPLRCCLARARGRWSRRTRAPSAAADPPARRAHSQAGPRDDLPRAGAVQPLQVADLVGVLALGGPPRRHVGLQRHLHHHRPARPRRLGQQRRRIGHVLEHVREDPQLVRAVAGAAGARRRRARTRSISCRAPAISTAAWVISTPSRRPPNPRARSSHSSAPSPQPISRVLVGDSPAREHSASTWSALPTAPSARQRAYRAASAGSSLCVCIVIEADQLGMCVHRRLIMATTEPGAAKPGRASHAPDLAGATRQRTKTLKIRTPPTYAKIDRTYERALS